VLGKERSEGKIIGIVIREKEVEGTNRKKRGMNRCDDEFRR
jgi:hypothetical protein